MTSTRQMWDGLFARADELGIDVVTMIDTADGKIDPIATDIICRAYGVPVVTDSTVDELIEELSDFDGDDEDM